MSSHDGQYRLLNLPCRLIWMLEPVAVLRK